MDHPSVTLSRPRVARLRLLSPPQSEPPYDEERPRRAHRARPAAIQGTLAPRFALPTGLTAVPARPAPERPAPQRPPPQRDQPQRQVPLRLVPPPGSPGPTARAEERSERVGQLNAWAHRLAQALLEVLCGNRPAAQLVSWTSGEVHAQIAAQVAALPWGRGAARGSRRPRPSPAGPRIRCRARVGRLYCPTSDVAEVAVVLDDGDRPRAAALRLERRGDRWLCTAVELG